MTHVAAHDIVALHKTSGHSTKLVATNDSIAGCRHAALDGFNLKLQMI